MTDFEPGESASIISVTEKVRSLAIGAPVSAVHFLGPSAAFVGAEENIFVVTGEAEIAPRAGPPGARKGGAGCRLRSLRLSCARLSPLRLSW